jgi:hypothetical protein
MAMGGARPGAGRKPGSGKESTERRRIAMEVMRQLNREGVTPLEIFGKMMRGDKTISLNQFEAAKAAAPYMHPRLSAVTVDANIKKDITDFTDEELYAIVGPGALEGADGDNEEEEGA